MYKYLHNEALGKTNCDTNVDKKDGYVVMWKKRPWLIYLFSLEK